LTGGGGGRLGRQLEKHSSGMSLESAASSGTTRSSAGGGTERPAAAARGLSRGAVLKKLGQQKSELSRKTSTTSSNSSLSMLGDINKSAAHAKETSFSQRNSFFKHNC
jgi:hypothetical protein